jgi:hypothetical protein
MADSPQADEEEDRELAEMIESVDRYHDEIRIWRARRLVRLSVIAIGGLLLLSALAWATGAAAGAALGGVLDFGAGPSAVERALFNLERAGRAVTYACLFSLAGILLLKALSRRFPRGEVPEPPETVRASEEDEDEETGSHEDWRPPSAE